MQLSALDWAIMAAYFTVSLGVGLVVSRRAGKDFGAFFLGGRAMPWWLLGISMVATTFSTDTPNLVADLVRSDGVFGNWAWWAFLLTGMLTVFLYARLWRRSGLLTDVAFYELRYSGRLAAFLRGVRAVYLGLRVNLLVMAAVTLAAIKIGGVMLGWSPLQTVLVAAGVTLAYSALGGLRGVVLTDLVQFVLAMVGSIGAAVYVVGLPEVGGWQALLEHENVQGSLAFWPSFETMTWEQIVPVFVIPLAVQWWAAYYPGAEPGGGSYVVQRMLAARDERHAAGATLLFNALHYALRPWPWIAVALASLVLFPDLDALAARFPDLPEQVVRNDLAYPAMLTFLPAGLLGLVVTSLAAAYMSTMSTQVNWGASILVHDVYQRFVRPEASERRLVWVGRLATAALMAAACTFALFLENALQIFEIIVQIGAGTGLLFLLRWFWWRINAWAELTAMVVSFAAALTFQFAVAGVPAWLELVLIVAITTAAWLAAAFLLPATDEATLLDFYRRVRPGGRGWRRVARRAAAHGLPALPAAASDLPQALAAAALGTLGIYSLLFATGLLLYGRTALGLVLAAVAAAALAGLAALWSRLRFE
ncbi:MAG: sodium:solute symporter family protein [Rhodothermales bacterium]|nr:sodium:solute symporter family protein [Rhodothermales bacterium]